MPRSRWAGVRAAGTDDTWLKVYLYSRAQSVMGGTSQIQRNLVASADPGPPGVMSAYDLTDELQVDDDGPVRIVRMNRPEQLNATNHGLHRGLAELFPQIDADDEVRAVVLTGNGRAFSAGGDFAYLDELARDAALRRETLAHGRQIVTGMVRVPRADRGRGQRTRGRARAAAWWRCRTSSTWPRARTWPIPT